MAYDDKISATIAFDYQDRPLKGLDGGRAILVNYDEIDFASTPRTALAQLVAFTLKAGGSAGFEIQWYKELASTSSAYAPNAEAVDGFSHSFLGRMSNASAANAEIAKELKDGRFLVIVETKYKGADGDDSKEAYKVYGFDSGLKLSEMTYASQENEGGILFTLATPEGMSERFPYQTLYAVSKTATDVLVTGLLTPTI